MVVAQATPEHLVTRATPEITALLEMAALEVTPVILEIQVAPEMLAGMVLADPVVLADLTVQALAAPAVEVVRVAVRELRDLRVAQVQVQPLAHQVIPVELVLMELQVIPEQAEVVLPVEIRAMRAAQDRRAVRVT
jgi:hypothetical protein